ncbi:VanZ family protein [Priestia aryabhattai]|uniref:VanZ family protein n=1 Tax=Priestia aryabhattai TaxID=412384 RepID=UPI001C3D5F6D
MILKRVLLLLLLLAISKFSNTPYLEVMHPPSWTNSSVWNHDTTLWSILRPGSEFYMSYSYGLNLEFILRKIAHLSFFGILGLLVFLNLREQKHRYVKAWFFGTVFAFLDELHQAFIIGRDGRMMDVTVDSFGSALFLFLLYKSKKVSKP